MMLLLLGCSHLHPGATDRDVEGSYDHVFLATLRTLEAKQFPIEEVNYEKGRIVTGKRPVRLIEGGGRVEKVRARIQREDGAADVRLFLTFMDQSGTVPRRAPARSNEKAAAIMDRMFHSSAVYDSYLDAIEQRVEDLQEAD